ncbi:MAG: hypothetical protein AB8B51_15145 [Sedimentitalea sp.]
MIAMFRASFCTDPEFRPLGFENLLFIEWLTGWFGEKTQSPLAQVIELVCLKKWRWGSGERCGARAADLRFLSDDRLFAFLALMTAFSRRQKARRSVTFERDLYVVNSFCFAVAIWPCAILWLILTHNYHAAAQKLRRLPPRLSRNLGANSIRVMSCALFCIRTGL